jgi:putative transposase
MTRKKKEEEARFPTEALDALIGETRTPDQLEELFREMKKRVVERMLGAELTHHLGYAPGEAKPTGQANHRNGTTPKTVLTDDGTLPLAVQRGYSLIRQTPSGSRPRLLTARTR